MIIVRKLLNTIYVTQEDLYVSKEGETIVFHQKNNKILQLPSHNIEGIVFFGNGMVTPALINMCAESDIKVSFISHTGKFLIKIQNPIKGNVRLRRTQYRLSDMEARVLVIAKSFMLGKLYNCRCVLQRLNRDHGDKINKTLVEQVIRQLHNSLQNIDSINGLSSLLGVEGEAAKNYYSVFNELITDKTFQFHGRNRRPPKDEVNALLSFFYTILAHDCEAALETVGLDPQVGFYHQERPGRSALALDMMEELRPYLVDRFVVSIINNRQVSKSDFCIKENEAVLLEPEAKKKLLQLWQTRKQDIIEHPYLKEKIEVGLIPYSQALLLARHIRGDMDGYPPFLMR